MKMRPKTSNAGNRNKGGIKNYSSNEVSHIDKRLRWLLILGKMFSYKR